MFSSSASVINKMNTFYLRGNCFEIIYTEKANYRESNNEKDIFIVMNNQPRFNKINKIISRLNQISQKSLMIPSLPKICRKIICILLLVIT